MKYCDITLDTNNYHIVKTRIIKDISLGTWVYAIIATNNSTGVALKAVNVDNCSNTLYFEHICTGIKINPDIVFLRDYITLSYYDLTYGP